jgi:hypothetical protein
MKTIQQQLAELNQMVLAGNSIEAFEKFYHKDVVMQENESAPTVGKEANRLREVEFYSNVEEFRNAEVRGVAIGENLSSVIWHYDYTHKVWGKRNYTQVSVQHWKDGLIVKEQFFYGN